MEISEKLNTRLIRSLVLLDRQYLITEQVSKYRVQRVLRSFEKSADNKSSSLKDIVRVYEMVFSLVDNIVRYEKIACVLPRMSQRTDEFKLFSNRLSGLKDLRNLLQHINGDIDTEFESPILGGVSWARGNANYIAAFVDMESKSLPGLPYDLQELKYAKQFCFVHNDKYYDLGNAIIGYRDYHAYVKKNFRLEVDGKPYLIEKHILAFKTELKSRIN